MKRIGLPIGFDRTGYDPEMSRRNIAEALTKGLIHCCCCGRVAQRGVSKWEVLGTDWVCPDCRHCITTEAW